MTIREYYTCYIMTCFLKIRIVDNVSACINAKNNFIFSFVNPNCIEWKFMLQP